MWASKRIVSGALVLSALFSALEPAISCSSCGCSEICPLAMMEVDKDERGSATTPILSNSIWGNIILKLAYRRDEQLAKLTKTMNRVNLGALNSFLLIAGDTLAQNAVSMATLNPPDGKLDSYMPGAIGLVADGATNLVLGGQMILTQSVKRRIRKRQREIQQMVEAILQQLEETQLDSSEPEKELASIIGAHASAECIQLWRSSHVTASLGP